MLHAKGGATIAGYNVQQAVDAKHKLIVAHEVTTERNDHASLEPTATRPSSPRFAIDDRARRHRLYERRAAAACEAQGITPVVPMPEAPNTQGAELYPKTQFTYDPGTDTYRCPAGELLRRYKRDRQAQTDYYWTSACTGRAQKPYCTQSQRRSIARSWYAGAAERAHQRRNKTEL